jgi:hypothetical protein
MAQDLDVVRHELSRRVAALDGWGARARPVELATAVDEIRVLADRAGLAPTVTVAHVIAAALARGERGPNVQGWLPLLGDAVQAPRQDRAACDTFAAMCAVRLGS